MIFWWENINLVLNFKYLWRHLYTEDTPCFGKEKPSWITPLKLLKCLLKWKNYIMFSCKRASVLILNISSCHISIIIIKLCQLNSREIRYEQSVVQGDINILGFGWHHKKRTIFLLLTITEFHEVPINSGTVLY